VGVLDPRRILVQAHDTEIRDYPDHAQTGERKPEADPDFPLSERRYGYGDSVIGGFAHEPPVKLSVRTTASAYPGHG